MNQKYSARIVPELENGLRESGLLTSLVTLDSPRFVRYLNKPANMLHDGWTYVEAENTGSAFYRLGEQDGTRQELVICRQSRQATLSTYQPRLGRTQTMVYSLASRNVLENSVVHDFGEHRAVHSFLFLNPREGRLTRQERAEAAA